MGQEGNAPLERREGITTNKMAGSASLSVPSHSNGSITASYLEVGSIVLGDVWTVALAEHCDLLLDVFDLVLGLLQVDGLDGHHILGAVVDALEHLSE